MGVEASSDGIRDAIDIPDSFGRSTKLAPGPPCQFSLIARLCLIRAIVGPDSCRGLQAAWGWHPMPLPNRRGSKGALWIGTARAMRMPIASLMPSLDASTPIVPASPANRHGRSSQRPLGAHARSSHLARCEPNGNPGQRAAQGSHPACWPDGRPRLRSFAPRRYRRSAGPLSAEPMGISRTILL